MEGVDLTFDSGNHGPKVRSDHHQIKTTLYGTCCKLRTGAMHANFFTVTMRYFFDAVTG